VGPKSLLPDLSPLEEFYAGRGIAVPPVWGVAPEDIPQPGRRLLVHESDMTSTLENFYGDKLRVHVLGHRAAGNEYFREVALTLERDGRPVEFGAIKISLDLFPAEARREILREKQPLGRILALFGMNFASRPAGYLRVLSDDVIGQALGLDGPQSLYGRRNTLWDAWDRPLAEIVEILSPT
jgi:chorismate-pyruvate lyase